MWEQVKSNKYNVIISLNYEDFAFINVEKRINNKGVTIYEINFHIEEVTDQSVELHNINEVSKILEQSKPLIEELYDSYDEFDDNDIYDWLDDFVNTINNY